MKINTASQVTGVQLTTAADGTAFTGTATVLVTVDGGTQSASGGTGPTHEGNGYHTYLPTQAETNGAIIGFTYTGSGAITTTVQVYTTFPQTGDAFVSVGALNDVAATDIVSSGAITTSAGAVSTVTTVATTTTNTDLVTAAAVRTEMDSNSTQLTAIVADTNELQTDDVPGLIAALNDPTSAAVADAVLDEALAGHVVAGSLGKAVADIETDATAILADTNELQTDDIPGLIAALNDLSAANVNTEVLDVMNTDTLTLPAQGAPSATPTHREAVMWLFKNFRNKKTQTATVWSLYNDDTTTVDSKATVSDDATTATKTEIATGP